MASEYTPNRRYPLYTDQDKPNLRDQYNQAIREIDGDIKTALDDSGDVADALGAGFDEQHTVRMAIDAANASVSDVNTALQSEVTARQNADNALSTSIADEATARQNADSALSTSIADEATARQNADSAINNALAKKQTKVLDGKTAVVYGDSTAVVGGSFFTEVAELLGLDITVRAISGTLVTPNSATPDSSANDLWNITNRANASTFDFDYVFLVYGTNDWQLSRAPFEEGGMTAKLLSFEYALKASVTNILNLNPDAIIVFVSPAYAYKHFQNQHSPNFNTLGYKLEVYSEVARKCMAEFGMCHIDLSGCGVTDSNYPQLMLNDSGGIYVHYNDTLKHRAAKYVAESFPWPRCVEHDVGTSFDLLTFKNYYVDDGGISSVLDATNIIGNTQYVGNSVARIDASSTIETNQEINLKNGIYVNFMADGRFKIYPTGSPQNFVYVNGYWNRMSAFIQNQSIDTITIENLDNQQMYIVDCVLSDTPFGWPNCRSMEIVTLVTSDFSNVDSTVNVVEGFLTRISEYVYALNLTVTLKSALNADSVHQLTGVCSKFKPILNTPLNVAKFPGVKPFMSGVIASDGSIVIRTGEAMTTTDTIVISGIIPVGFGIATH